MKQCGTCYNVVVVHVMSLKLTSENRQRTSCTEAFHWWKIDSSMRYAIAGFCSTFRFVLTKVLLCLQRKKKSV